MSNKLTERLNEITGVSFVSVTYVNQHNEKHQTLFKSFFLVSFCFDDNKDKPYVYSDIL
jgi:hypothetical protein